MAELGPGYRVVTLDGQFVVGSNLEPADLEAALDVMRRVRRALETGFLRRPPTTPVRVYLFRDRSTYETASRRLGRDPGTPFGFYLSGERRVMVNWATGAGTLAHELVHPLLAEDFPEAPPWFGEGFASLFEECEFQPDGSFVVRPNWRLPTLQNALKSDRAIPLSRLLEASAHTLYGPDSSLHYAEARFLCAYLHEQGLLTEFYRAFRQAVRTDPTGARTLESTVGASIDEFEKAWRLWASGLAPE